MGETNELRMCALAEKNSDQQLKTLKQIMKMLLIKNGKLQHCKST
jgi:mannitol/fructose-specific phosphotransferase system IIA component (Ntr-type)